MYSIHIALFPQSMEQILVEKVSSHRLQKTFRGFSRKSFKNFLRNSSRNCFGFFSKNCPLPLQEFLHGIIQKLYLEFKDCLRNSSKDFSEIQLGILKTIFPEFLLELEIFRKILKIFSDVCFWKPFRFFTGDFQTFYHWFLYGSLQKFFLIFFSDYF